MATWQERLPQELRLASTAPLGKASQFLSERYIAKVNQKFVAKKGTAFRRCRRNDLRWIFLEPVLSEYCT